MPVEGLWVARGEVAWVAPVQVAVHDGHDLSTGVDPPQLTRLVVNRQTWGTEENGGHSRYQACKLGHKVHSLWKHREEFK